MGTSSRSHDHAVKEHLLAFAREEYSTKKPLELRVLQLKPQTVFQRGAMFPHLLIKALQAARFIVYLDLGEEIRFYFFNQDGLSLGASTYEKTEKMLKEMHGKATTLLKLPKIEPLADVDQRGQVLQGVIKKLYPHLDQKYHIPSSPFPFVSVRDPHGSFIERLNDISGGHSPMQFGVTPTRDGFTLDARLFQHPLQEVILRREYFLMHTVHEDPTEAYAAIALLWACADVRWENKVSREEIQTLIKQLQNENPSIKELHNQISEGSLLIQKWMEWLEKVFIPQIYPIPRDTPFFPMMASSLIKWGRYLADLPLEWRNSCANLTLFWIMKTGKSVWQNWPVELTTDECMSWLLVQIMQSTYAQESLLQQYLPAITTFLRTFDLWFSYLGAFYLLKGKSRIEWEMLPVIPPIEGIRLSILEERVSYLQTLQIGAFFHDLPIKLTSYHKSLWNPIIETLVTTRALEIEAPTWRELAANASVPFIVVLHNRSDWVFTNFEITTVCSPASRASVTFAEAIRAPIFDTIYRIPLLLTTTSISGSFQVRILGAFTDPFDPNLRRQISLLNCAFTIEI